VSLFVFSLTMYQILLYIYTGQTKFIIITSTENRNKAELQKVIGLFANLIPLKIKINENQQSVNCLIKQKKN